MNHSNWTELPEPMLRALHIAWGFRAVRASPQTVWSRFRQALARPWLPMLLPLSLSDVDSLRRQRAGLEVLQIFFFEKVEVQFWCQVPTISQGQPSREEAPAYQLSFSGWRAGVSLPIPGGQGRCTFTAARGRRLHPHDFPRVQDQWCGQRLGGKMVEVENYRL